MNRALLERPFAPAQIRQRKGRNGMLDYVEGHSVIARLNEALDGAWSFEVTHHEVREDEVVVPGRTDGHRRVRKPQPRSVRPSSPGPRHNGAVSRSAR